MTKAKQGNTSTQRTQKQTAKKKARISTLSHMQFMDWKMKERINAKWKEALKDPLYKCAIKHDQTFNPKLDSYTHLGPMNVQCKKGCGAVHFNNEGLDSTCCDDTGHGSFDLLQEVPGFMQEFLKDVDFRNKIRNYNCAFQIAHMGSSLESSCHRNGIFVHNKEFPFYIRVHGQLYHGIPPVIPKVNQPPKFAQIYVVDNVLEEMCNNKKNRDLDKAKMERILEYMNERNPWARAIRKSARNYLRNNPDVTKVILDFVPHAGHQYRMPKEDIIAGFVPTGKPGEFHRYRSVYLHNADGTFHSIDDLNVMYDPAHFVLMFLNGDGGYSPDISKGKEDKKHETIQKFYQQRLHIRPGRHVALGRYGRLFHEYAIDMYFKVENSRLSYIRYNQKTLRGSNSPETRSDDVPVGQDEGHSFVYLPRSFTGGPRYYRAKFLDGITAVNRLGAGTCLVTMTTNPNWPEIQENLAPGEKATDRPDLVARIFKMKWEQLKNDITKHHVLGFCIAQEDVHEFQKSGLPHGHMIAILAKQDQPRTPEDINNIVCAELPDKYTDPEGFRLVTRHMLHGPCEEGKCLDRDNQCTKHFPFDFLDKTVWHGDQRVQYRRRNDGRTFVGKKGFIFDNRYVVPYNMYLLRKYQCHLNVLVCSTKIAAVRYLFGYINKGTDMATVKATVKNDDDEIETFLNGRYMTAPEACHKLFGFEVLNISPPTVRLPVHLEGRKWRIIGEVGGQRQTNDKPSELEAFFLLNRKRLANNETGDLYYNDVSKYYIWDKDDHVWKERKNCDKSKIGYSLNRIDNVSVRVGELYYLRMLLLRVPNPTCYDDLLTVDGTHHAQYSDACRAMGLLADDETWDATLKEAESYYTPKQVRSVFAQILVFGEPCDPLKLWTDHYSSMGEDFRKVPDTPGVTEEQKESIIEDVEKQLNSMQSSFVQFPSLAFLLPKHQQQERKGAHVVNEVIFTQQARNEFLDEFKRRWRMTNDEQAEAMEEIMNSIRGENEQKLFILNAAAGTGKTFVNGAFIYYVRWESGENLATIQVSTTAISAQLLLDAFTAHSTFKLPLRIDGDGRVRCAIELDSSIAQMMRSAKVLIWDEAMSARKELIEAVDHLFRELMGIDKPFGGLVVILSGDNRQTLPKLPRARRGDIINACLHNSYLMPHFRVINLVQNERLHRAGHPKLEGTSTLEDFQQFLLDMGDGKLKTDEEGRILVPDYIENSRSLDDLVDFVYTKDVNRLNASDLSERAILCPLNEDVREVNNIVLDRLQGTSKTYFSTDSELDPLGDTLEELPIDVLHSINRSGLPVHKLILKEKCVLMCLRNMSMGDICNGTKLYLDNARQHTLECTVLTGRARGTRVVLPRITLTDDSAGPDAVRLRRKQFPVALAYACSIDKSQGQSLKLCGLYCRTECFAHGQCYTAFSRPVGPEFLAIYKPDSQTDGRKCNNKVWMKNVVWPEAFPDRMDCT